MCLAVLQDDYEDLRNRMEPLSQSVQALQAEKDALTQQLQQVCVMLAARDTCVSCVCRSWAAVCPACRDWCAPNGWAA